tara:strand:+ start:97 stop:795 length:699 start_codon:yes stop_codon:yes gene_type:complete
MYNIVVTNLSDVNQSQINIKKPIEYPKNEFIVFDIYYNNNYFLILLNNVKICHKGNNIKFIETNSCISDIKNIIINTINRVKENTKYQEYFKKKEFHSMIEDNKVINFKNNCEYDTCVYDIEQNEIEIDRLKTNDNVSVIIYVKNIWINEKYYGVNIKLSQIQRKEPVGLKTNFFMRNITKISIPPPPPPPMKREQQRTQEIKKKEKELVVRPSLADILNSRNKLRKTNLLS